MVILHLGDSHLQSDQFSQPLRSDLQKKFGDAGRGLVFPYTVARSSESADLIDESNAPWVVRRSAVKAPEGWAGLEAGVSGFALLTQSPNYVLRLGLRNRERFDQITVFRRHDAAALGMAVSLHADRNVLGRAGLVPRDALHTVLAGETLFRIAKSYDTTVAHLMRWNHLKDARIWPDDTLVVGRRKVPALQTVVPPGFKDVALLAGGASESLSETVRLPQSVTDVFLRGSADGVSEDAAVLDGFVLEHAGASGVLYHCAGVNGAKARDFARGRRFLQQALCLHPDLVILSFGTNEANSATYDLADLRKSIATLAKTFSAQGALVLVSTPPDGLDWLGHRNPRTELAAQALREVAQSEGLALWDWNKVMGGVGAAETWRRQGYMQSDGVHLSPAGYRLQESLFWQALMDAYGRR